MIENDFITSPKINGIKQPLHKSTSRHQTFSPKRLFYINWHADQQVELQN